MKQLAIRLSWQTTPAKSLVMSEHVDAERIVRVPQPPDQSSNAGNRAAAANRGGLFLGYFLLATQKKVTGVRGRTQRSWFFISPFMAHSYKGIFFCKVNGYNW